MRILIFGLSGSGKSTLAQALYEKLVSMGIDFVRINGDNIRQQHNDWDFSTDGRLRQAERIKQEADQHKHTIIDFIAPLEEHRAIVEPDYIIWMDTVKSSQYYDTDNIFQCPTVQYCDEIVYNIHYDLDYIINGIVEYYKSVLAVKYYIT